jgi:hypothetical protein
MKEMDTCHGVSRLHKPSSFVHVLVAAHNGPTLEWVIVQTYCPFQFELCLPMNLSKSLCAYLRTSCGFSGLAKWLPHNWTYHTVSPVEVSTATGYPDYSTSLASSNMPPFLCRQTGRAQ